MMMNANNSVKQLISLQNFLSFFPKLRVFDKDCVANLLRDKEAGMLLPGVEIPHVVKRAHADYVRQSLESFLGKCSKDLNVATIRVRMAIFGLCMSTFR